MNTSQREPYSSSTCRVVDANLLAILHHNLEHISKSSERYQSQDKIGHLMYLDELF